MTFFARALTRVNQCAQGATSGTAAVGATQNSLWRYATADAAATVETSGYFTAAGVSNVGVGGNLLTVGDVIMASMVVSGTPVFKTYVVLTNPAVGPVTIGLQTTTAG